MPISTNRGFEIDTSHVDASIRELSKAIGQEGAANIVMESLQTAAQPLESIVRSNTPVDTGYLKSRVRTDSFFARGTSIPHVAVGWHIPGGRPALVKWAIAANVIEYGSKFRRAERTLRNAFDRQRANVVQTFSNKFVQLFNRTIPKPKR